jgi:acetyl-CoA carboxylase biotin carboxylase subunit
MIETILIANRGEIACRIIRTCRQLGIRAVAVYSDADSTARHVRLADEAIHIGPPPVAQSYLLPEAIISAAHRCEADAIHPGFGFLAENAEFARACDQAGLIFIGPAAETIAAMGDKRAAKELMSNAAVPVIPGYHGDAQSDVKLLEEAERLSFPVMVKPADGGGGKGIRVVVDPAQLADALKSARREALQAFGSDSLLLETPLTKPRHIEIQVFGDQHGNIIHLGERECSIQRRYQKVIEEAPSPALTSLLREQIFLAAVTAAQAIDYTNAGTVEFLLDENDNFYFLEMNTRLQVEHPVTEMVTGLDLVEWQIRIAEGEPLPLSQHEIETDGHAIEARLYAENPANDFLPATGEILLWREPIGKGIRVESGIQAGDRLSLHYDPMLAKLIAHGRDRKTAVRRLKRALELVTLLGPANNLALLHEVIRHPLFLSGDFDTHFLEHYFADWRPPEADRTAALVVAALAQLGHTASADVGYWRNNPNRPLRYCLQPTDEDDPVDVEFTPVTGAIDTYEVGLSGTKYVVAVNEQDGPDWVLTVDGHRHSVTVVSSKDTWWVKTRTGVVSLRAVSLLPEPQTTAGSVGTLRAPMPGAVLAIMVEVGQRVSKGQALMKLEAMKMEHTIRTTADGVVEAIFYRPGDTVDADAQLLKIGEVRD